MVADPRFVVEDIMSRRIVCDDLPITGWSYSGDLNRAGALSGNLAVASPFATDEVLSPWRRAIYAVLDGGRVDWGGIIVATPRQIGGQAVQISCIGWLGYLDHRFIRTGYVPTNVEQFSIVRQLVLDAQNESVFGPGFNLGIDVVWDKPSGIVRSFADDFQPWKQKTIGSAISDMAGSTDGFDYVAEFTVDAAANRITRNIRLHFPVRGRVTQFLYDLERGQPSPIREWGSAESGDFAWTGDGWGGGSDTNRVKVSATDDTARGIYPPIDASLSFSGVNSVATLSHRTAAAIARTSRPMRLPVIRVDPIGPPAWSELALGDSIRVRINDGYGSIGVGALTEFRIIGTKVTSDGTHELTLFGPKILSSTAPGGEPIPPVVVGPLLPAPPLSLNATPGNGFVILSWDADIDAPTGLVATPGDGRVVLAWVNPSPSVAPRSPVITSATPGSSSVTLTWTQAA